MSGRRFPEDPKGKDIVCIGTGAIAEVAYQYFLFDSPHKVVAFSIERDFLSESEKFGLPIVPLDRLEEDYPPCRFGAFVAIGYFALNRLRARLYAEAKAKGYELVSYISSEAFVWQNAQIGDNCFILEDNIVQPFVQIGNDATFWSGNHIGHHSVIGDHAFISSHVVISGGTKVGEYCFAGVNSALADGIKIGPDCVIGMGAIVTKDIPARTLIMPCESTLRDLDSLSSRARRYFHPEGK